MTFQIVSTDDGSVSCLDSETGQLCHNSAGAYTEAVQNYVRPSKLLQRVGRVDHIRVLDACYGMGYNSWALINELIKQGNVSAATGKKPFTLSIVAIEKHPEVVHFLPRVLEHPTFDALEANLSPSEHNIYYRTLMGTNDTKGSGSINQFAINIANWFRLEFTLCIDDIRNKLPQLSDDFDAIFHDPFSPQKMPELWTEDLFSRYHNLLLSRQGVLLTYSTAAAVRGGLRAAGFQVLKTRGLGKKAGSTLALTTATSRADYEDLSIPLEAWEEEYLQSKAGIPYRDKYLTQSRHEILAQRQSDQNSSGLPSGSSALKTKNRCKDPSFQG